MAGFNLGDIFVTFKAKTEDLQRGTKELQNMANSAEKSGEKVSSFGDKLGTMAKKTADAIVKIATVATTAATVAGGFAIKSAADFEQTRIGIENMVGSADKARSILLEVSKFAAETPFEFPELASSVKQLIAFGFTGEDAIATMKQLGDVSAAIGAPIGDLSYLMGTLKTQGRAMTIDIRQFAMRGIPIYQYLGQVLNKTGAEITDMIETGQIGFPEVQKAFEAMTGAGGQFYGTMAKQSKSLSGLWSTFKDNIGFAAREIIGINQQGDVREGSIFDKLRNGVSGLNTALGQIDWVGVVNKVTIFFGNMFEKVYGVAKQVGDYLVPKLQALWTTINNDVLPVLKRLWEEVLKPLLPVIGVALVAAIGLAIDALNLLLTVITPVMNFILDNKPLVIGLATAFGILALAMNFGKIASAFTGAMDIVISKMVATQTAASGLVSFLGGPLMAAGWAAFAAAAVAAGVLIWNKYNQTLDVLTKVQSAIAKNSNAEDEAGRQITAAYNAGKITKQQYQAYFNEMATPEGTASGNWLSRLFGFAEGGFTGAGRASEIAGVVHRGEYVLPQSQVDQATGQPKATGGNTFHIHLDGIMARSESELADIMEQGIQALDRRLTGAGKPRIMKGQA